MGIFWMVVTGLNFVLVAVLVKYLGPRIPAAQAAFLRFALGLVFLLPMVRPMLTTRLSPRQLGLFTLRGVAHTIGVALWFYAMARMPVAEVVAMNYLAPVYVTIGAALVLGEPLALRRILAVGVALVGALIILRPGFREISPAHLAMLGTALAFAIGYLVAKKLSHEVSPAVIVGMLSLMVLVGLAPSALWVWVAPEPMDYVILFAIACFATLGHYSMTLAFAAAPVSITQPAAFLQLLWGALLGLLLFKEPIDVWVIGGGALIVAAVSFIAWRESLRSRAQKAPP